MKANIKLLVSCLMFVAGSSSKTRTNCFLFILSCARGIANFLRFPSVTCRVCFKASNFAFVKHLTNRFHVAVRLFSNRSQMTSKCGKNKKVAHEAQPSVSLMFLPHFDVFCDLLLNQTHGNMESICFI